MIPSMVKIHVGRAGTKLGEFTIEEIRTGLSTGQFLSSDLGWRPGMSQWEPLSSFPEIAAASASSTPPLPPGGVDEPRQEIAVENEPAWERKEELGFVRALFRTIQTVLLQPSQTFANLKRAGGLLNPLAFYLITSVVGGAGGVLYSYVFPGFESFTGMEKQQTPASLATSMLMLPIIQLISIFVWSGLVHLGLMLVNGAQRNYETTFRVACYASGSSAVIALLPIWICGGVIGWIWGLVVAIIGLSRAHPTSGGKASFAVLLPVVLCCGLGFLAAITLGIFAKAAATGGLAP
jgi:hypothetical protein